MILIHANMRKSAWRVVFLTIGEDLRLTMRKFPKLVKFLGGKCYLWIEVLDFFESMGYGNEFQNMIKNGPVTNDGGFGVYKKDFEKFCEHIGLSIG